VDTLGGGVRPDDGRKTILARYHRSVRQRTAVVGYQTGGQRKERCPAWIRRRSNQDLARL
jgi:hypothetical protein